jgi:hypothetical protein
VHTLTFTNAGCRLVSGGADCSVRFWDLATSLEDPKDNRIVTPASSHHTKQTPIFHLGCTHRDLLSGVGPFSIEEAGRFASSFTDEQRMDSMGVVYIQPT